MMPQVSVVIAAYNAAETLPATLDSLHQQTFTDFEIVAVDDCSTDETHAMLCSYQPTFAARGVTLRVLQNGANSGAARTGWAGIQVAEGAYIARLDADDTAHPDWLTRTHQQLTTTGAVLCLCWHRNRYVETGGHVDVQYPDDDAWMKWHLLFGNIISNSGSMWPVAMNRHYDLEHVVAHDYATWLPMANEGAFTQVEQLLIERLVDPRSLSERKAHISDAEAAKLRNATIRRRLGDAPYSDTQIERMVALQHYKVDAKSAESAARDLLNLYNLFCQQYNGNVSRVTAALNKRRKWLLKQCETATRADSIRWLLAALRLTPTLSGKGKTFLRGVKRIVT